MLLTLIELPFAQMHLFWLLLLLAVGFFALASGGDILTSVSAAVSVNFMYNPLLVGLTGSEEHTSELQ